MVVYAQGGWLVLYVQGGVGGDCLRARGLQLLICEGGVAVVYVRGGVAGWRFTHEGVAWWRLCKRKGIG